MSAKEAGGLSPASRKLAVVIGAGVAGCQAARALLRAGYDALVLEQGRGLGGVWRRNYHSFGLQVPWFCYSFPEFPYHKAPKELAERAVREGYPSGETVKEYIAAYCAHFNLDRHIVYGAKVVHLGALPCNRWSVRFRHSAAADQSIQLGPLKTMEADVVVLATGMYYSPYVPSVPGLASFEGTVLHARDFASVSGLTGKRVLVLGGGKSATDCAVVASSPAAAAAAVTTLFRQAHWPMPRQLFGLPFHRVVYTRFTAAMLPMYYTAQGTVRKRLKHGLMAPLKRLFWSSVESHVARKMQLRGSLRPELGFVQDLFFGGQIQDGSWNEAVNAGRVSAVQGSLAEVRPGGVRLTDGTVIDCDVLIFATGYTKDYSLFDAATAGRLMMVAGETPGDAVRRGGLHLYRSIISPWVPNLYFIGCEANSFNNILTSALQSLWMMHHVTGRLQLLGPQELMKDIQKQRSWRRSVMPPQHYCSSSIMLYQQRYHDQLVRDMGQPTERKRATRRGGSECFGVYTSEDYADLFVETVSPGLVDAAAAAPPPRPADAVVAASVTLMPAAAAIGARLDLAVMPGGGSAAAAADPAAAAAAVGRRAVLMPVCTEHSDAVAIAVAPGEEVVTAPSSTGNSAFIRTLDSPAKLPMNRGVQAAATVAAAVNVNVKSNQPPNGTVTAAGPDEDRCTPTAMTVLDINTTSSCGCNSAGPITPFAVSNMSNVQPSTAVNVLDGGGGGGFCANGFSPFTEVAARAAASAAAAAAQQARTPSSPRPRLTLAHRVRLQVLQLVHRGAGGSGGLQPTASGGVVGGCGGEGVEGVLEFRLTPNVTQSGRLADSTATTNPSNLYCNANAATGGVHRSSSLYCDSIRHAAPNVYSELVGTLDVH